jgi:hypothetical protein
MAPGREKPLASAMGSCHSVLYGREYPLTYFVQENLMTLVAACALAAVGGALAKLLSWIARRG